VGALEIPVVTTLEQIALKHAQSFAPWEGTLQSAAHEHMLAALREAVEECARICEKPTGDSFGNLRYCAAAIRAWGEGK
jgi:hypothetical protein